MMTKTGTVAFSAPEIFTQRVYNEKVDVWSAGIVLYMMLSGKQPFFEENVPRLVQQITNDPVDLKDESLLDVSSEALDLIEIMLTKDPSKRPSAKECLNDLWLYEDEKINQLRKESPNRKESNKRKLQFLGNASLHLQKR